MVKVLASIASAEEAKIMARVGMDIIDMKSPQQGALGALSTAQLRNIVTAVDRQVPTSATIGDIPADSTQLLERILETAETGVDYVKVGLFSQQVPSIFQKQLRQTKEHGIKVVLVIFGEYYRLTSILPLLSSGSLYSVMLDTFDKKGKRLPDLLSPTDLASFIEQSRQYGLLTGLAGSLKIEDIDTIVPLKPDYLGFRGALCEAGVRNGKLSISQAKRLKQKLQTSQSKFSDQTILGGKYGAMA